MSKETPTTARWRLGQVLAFARAAEPRAAVSRRAILADVTLAVLVFAAALAAAKFSDTGSSITHLTVNRRLTTYQYGGRLRGLPWQVVVAALVISAPLAARRWRPLAAFLVLLLGVVATRRYASDVTFLAIVFAAYSAVVHSRFRGAAVLSLPLAGILVAVDFWNASPAARLENLPPGPLPADFPMPAATPWRLPGLVVTVSLLLVAIVGNAVQAGNRARRLRAENEAATRRAVELERARIASELHDVVTHNVSVMIVQAGAARQVLAEAPGEAREALLAVESSGRAAMTELRHLLGLLSPVDLADPADPAAEAPGPGPDGTAAGQELRPHPGLAQLPALIDRVTAAGLPVELRIGQPDAAVPPELPPGLDLAAYRIVQEALTNVLKHAGKPQASVGVSYREGDLVLEITDAGRPIPAAGPLPTAGQGHGRGLLGLRERTALYRGEFSAGPQPGGGWRVLARIPVDPPPG